ncbi:MAG TPA: beta-ketoacyl-ACP synthase III [Pirellulaceae bacterium]|nr:beta-ketoacyl-ACP synthase III [Pirellulaceae bacterium]
MTVTETRVEIARPELNTQVIGVRALSTAIGIPSLSLENHDLQVPGCDPDWIVQRTGIKRRFHADQNTATSDMVYQAAVSCLAAAGVDAKEIDLLIVATMTPDHFTPSSSCLVQSRLGAQCAAFDLNAACSGFMYALVTGCQFIKSGCSRKALIVGADKMSLVVDPLDPKTYPLFGDGAGAVLLSADPRPADEASGILAYQLGSEGEMGGTLVVPAGGSRQPINHQALDAREQYLRMDGRAVFKWAVRLVPKLVYSLLEQAKLVLDDIDVLICHQANKRIIDAAIDVLGVCPDKVFVNVDRFGNTSAASIPISIHEACQQGRIRPGSNVLMAGFGAGLTWGGCIFRW